MLFTKPIYQAKPISLFVGKYDGWEPQGIRSEEAKCRHGNGSAYLLNSSSSLKCKIGV
jgi:hypothetical protein